MRYVKSTALLVGLLATLVLSSTAVLAVEVDASVDKRIVAPGGTLTVTATVTDDDGTPGNFDYRIAVIGPGQSDGGERIIICDSEKQNTNGNSNVTFACSIPTIEGLQSLGIENAAERAVIPLKGGIAVDDPASNETNKTVKKHGKALIVNTDKFKAKYEQALDRLDAFISRAQELIARCDNITASAEEAGAEHVIDRCTKFQEKMQEQIDKALSAQERINAALAKLDDPSSLNFDHLKDAFVNFRNGARDFKIEVKDIKDFVDKARVDLEKRVAKEIVDRAKEKTKQLREEIKEKARALDERLKDVRKERSGGETTEETTKTETSESTTSESSGSTSESSSGSSGSGESGSSGGGG